MRLESHGHLDCGQALALPDRPVFGGEAVLKLALEPFVEAVRHHDFRARSPSIPGPAADIAEELLAPAEGAEKLRRQFVLGFQVIGCR